MNNWTKADVDYNVWMKAVNKLVRHRCGISADDLPDWLSRDAFDDECTVAEAADACLESAGFEDAAYDENNLVDEP